MKSKLMMLVVLLAVAVSAQANLVPNGNFETIFKPGTTMVATIEDGVYFGIGGQTIKGPGEATYADGTTGTGVLLPGWTPVLGTNSDVMLGGDWGGTDGSMALMCFAGWGGPTTVEASVPLSVLGLNAGEALRLSADVFNNGGPVILELLVDGVVIAPDAASDPALVASDWVELSRTYNSIPAGNVTIQVGTRDDAGTGWGGNRVSIDNVALNIVPEPATLVLLALGGLALRRRRNS